jgi:hypothetical protein
MRTNLVVNPKLPGIADGQQGSFIRMKQKSSHPCTMPSVHINFRLLSVFLLLLLPGFLSFCPTEIYAQAAAPAKPQPPATVLLIRHAEKLTDGRIDLSPTGFERARLLPKCFRLPQPNPISPPGKTVLVVWHHGKIPQLASALGRLRRTLHGRTRSTTASGESTMQTVR